MKVPFVVLFGFSKGTQRETGQEGTTGERKSITIIGALRNSIGNYLGSYITLQALQENGFEFQQRFWSLAMGIVLLIKHITHFLRLVGESRL